MNAQQWYEFWRANCRWCGMDGGCAEQDRIKSKGDERAQCSQVRDKYRKDKKR